MENKIKWALLILDVFVFLVLVNFGIPNVIACAPPLSTCCAVPVTINDTGTGCEYDKVCSLPSVCTGRVLVCGVKCWPEYDYCGPLCRWCSRYPTTGCSQGGGGEGNNPPSCTINLQSPITYDGMEYLYDSYNPIRGINAPPNPPPPDDWSRVVIPPTTVEGQISTSDPDGDRVRITRLTVSKPECLEVTRNGKTLYATPQGKIRRKDSDP